MIKVRSNNDQITHYRVHKDKPEITSVYVDIEGRDHTLAEVIEVVESYGGTLENTTFSGGILVSVIPSTEADRERWRMADAKSEASAYQSRYDWYLRLKKEFEDG